MEAQQSVTDKDEKVWNRLYFQWVCYLIISS